MSVNRGDHLVDKPNHAGSNQSGRGLGSTCGGRGLGRAGGRYINSLPMVVDSTNRERDARSHWGGSRAATVLTRSGRGGARNFVRRNSNGAAYRGSGSGDNTVADTEIGEGLLNKPMHYKPTKYYLTHPMPSLIANVILQPNKRTLSFIFTDGSNWIVVFDDSLKLETPTILHNLANKRLINMFECRDKPSKFLSTEDHLEVIVDVSDSHGDTIQQVLLGTVSFYDCPYYGGEGTLCHWEVRPSYHNDQNILFDARSDCHCCESGGHDGIVVSPVVCDVAVMVNNNISTIAICFDNEQQTLPATQSKEFIISIINPPFIHVYGSCGIRGFRVPNTLRSKLVGHRIKQIYETWDPNTIHCTYVCHRYSNHYFHHDFVATWSTFILIVLESNEVVTIERGHHSRETSYWVTSGWVTKSTNVNSSDQNIVVTSAPKYKNTARVTFIIGLPCSGKTTYAQQTFVNSEKEVIFDDVLFLRVSDTVIIIRELLKQGKHVIIIDPRFCQKETFQDFLKKLFEFEDHCATRVFPTPISTTLVEASPEICISRWKKDPILFQTKHKLDCNICSMYAELQGSLNCRVYPNMVKRIFNE